MVPSLPLLSCESSVSVKENPYRKKKKFYHLYEANFEESRQDLSKLSHKDMRGDQLCINK